MASPPLDSDSVSVLRKRGRASHLHNNCDSTECFLSDNYGAGIIKRQCQIDQQQKYQASSSSSSSSSSSCLQSTCVSASASPATKEGDGILGEEYSSLLQAVEWGVPASVEAADSTTGSSLLSTNSGPEQTLQQLRRTLSQEQERCCDGSEENQVDINCFLSEGWDDIDDAVGLGFDPETVFHSDGMSGLPADCSDDAAFSGCSAENGNWFLNDLESEGNAFLNEVLDHEWMAAAVANLDKINDTLDADSCMLHLLESGAGI